MPKEKSFQCFGEYAGALRCRRCEYRKSCEYYTNTRSSAGRPHCESVSYEAIADWHSEVADNSSIPGESEENEQQYLTIDKLAEFFKYLLNLDKCTLELLKLLFDDNCERSEMPSIAELAAKRGCSRQAVHRKILNIIGEHPELSRLFSLTLRHLPRDRRRYAGA